MDGKDTVTDATAYPLSENRILTPDLPPAEVEAALEALPQAFGQDWLEQRSPFHPVRDLWRRGDFIATQELFLLGDSIRLLKDVDNAWLRKTVHDAKSTQVNRRGPLFEIVALGALARGGHRITPHAHGGEDYDLDVTLDDGRIVRISLKHFGILRKTQDFMDRAHAAARHVKKQAAAKGRRWLGVLAQAQRYPESADWIALDIMLKRFADTNAPSAISQGIWELHPIRAPLPYQSLAFSWPSYDIQIVAPHHALEEKAYQDKIAEACSDLNRAVPAFSANVEPVVLIRLDEAAPLNVFEQWSKEHVALPDTRIAGILLMQSTIAVNVVQDTTSIYYTVAEAPRPGLNPIALRFVLPTGVNQSVQPHIVLPDGTLSVDHHTYVENQVYEAKEFNLTSSTVYEGASRDVVGRAWNPVMRLTQNGESSEVVLNRRHPSPTRLTLFS